MGYGDVIVSIFWASGGGSFLELGVARGGISMSLAARGADVTGVDVVECPDYPGRMYVMPAEEYFAVHARPDSFDMVFIDADHRYASVILDLQGALFVLKPHGTIVLHDTDPDREEMLADHLCSDCYRVVSNIQNSHDLASVTLPVDDTGLTLVRRKADRRVLSFVEEP